jgi:hypothetical protein
MQSSIHPSFKPKSQNNTTLPLTVNMSFIPNHELQRQRYPSQPMPHRNQDRTVSTTSQNYPTHGTSPGGSTMALPRSWPQQDGPYPNLAPGIGQNNYTSNARSMGGLLPSFPNPGMVSLPSAYNPQMIKPQYTSPYDDSWNNSYDTMAPMTVDQPVWERSNLGFSNYQQHSPSRSDGSASTQVSSLSSPYTHPSPHIKLEQQPELSPYNSPYAFQHATHQQSKFAGTGPGPMIAPRSHRPTATSLVSYGHMAEDVKYDFDAYDLESLSLSGNSPTVTPGARPKRGRTTPEEAVCACEICGKLFKRSNNLKTHMQLHGADRVEHKCEYGDCERTFYRKTDLARHEQSVSLSCLVSAFRVDEFLLTDYRCT